MLTFKTKTQQTQRGIFNRNSVSQRSGTRDNKDSWNMFLTDKDIKKCMTNMYNLSGINVFHIIIPKRAVSGIAYFPLCEISMNQKRKSRPYLEWCVITLVVPCRSAREVYGQSLMRKLDIYDISSSIFLSTVTTILLCSSWTHFWKQGQLIVRWNCSQFCPIRPWKCPRMETVCLLAAFFILVVFVGIKFICISYEPPFFQFTLLVSHPLTANHCEEAGSVFSTHSRQLLGQSKATFFSRLI